MSPAGGGNPAVRTCGATTGFFVLQRCEQRARAGCARCTRSLCERHTLALPGDPSPVCPECFAAARGYVDDPDDPGWAVSYRRTFYWELSSLSGDESWWADFDEVDREGFDDVDHGPGHDHGHGHHDDHGHGHHDDHGHGHHDDRGHGHDHDDWGDDHHDHGDWGDDHGDWGDDHGDVDGGYVDS